MNADRDHLDAETIAAWMDGGLDDASLAAAEAHASSCERCRELLAAVARTTPVVVVEKRPFRIPAWWYPLAAGAAAAVIWMVVPEQREIATAPPTPAAVREEARPQAEAPPAAADKKELDNKLKADKQEAKNDAPGARAEAAAEPSAARVAPAAPAAPAALASADTLQKTARANATPEVVAPDASKRWRFADYGPDVTTGAAVSSTVCWLAGRGGLVMVTTNGTTFDHVDLPERVDIVSITAADARSATITTADGRRFQTTDRGRNWRQIQA